MRGRGGDLSGGGWGVEKVSQITMNRNSDDLVPKTRGLARKSGEGVAKKDG